MRQRFSPNLNVVLISGAVTSDIDMQFDPSGKARCHFSMVYNQPKKNSDGTWDLEKHFFDVTAWDRAAETMGEKASEGTEVLVEGSLRYSKWEDAAGHPRSKVSISARRVQVLSRPAKDDSPPEQPNDDSFES